MTPSPSTQHLHSLPPHPLLRQQRMAHRRPHLKLLTVFPNPLPTLTRPITIWLDKLTGLNTVCVVYERNKVTFDHAVFLRSRRLKSVERLEVKLLGPDSAYDGVDGFGVVVVKMVEVFTPRRLVVMGEHAGSGVAMGWCVGECCDDDEGGGRREREIWGDAGFRGWVTTWVVKGGEGVLAVLARFPEGNGLERLYVCGDGVEKGWVVEAVEREVRGGDGGGGGTKGDGKVMERFGRLRVLGVENGRGWEGILWGARGWSVEVVGMGGVERGLWTRGLGMKVGWRI
ncbi:hypothetical protein BC829DRAFT_435167 [Chytridium lagenaria]|nr:hypothetical protein BC829DRAFT_435167 [Chytridium lagenaria]